MFYFVMGRDGTGEATSEFFVRKETVMAVNESLSFCEAQ